jgi:hypothetical protein
MKVVWNFGTTPNCRNSLIKYVSIKSRRHGIRKQMAFSFLLSRSIFAHAGEQHVKARKAERLKQEAATEVKKRSAIKEQRRVEFENTLAIIKGAVTEARQAASDRKAPKSGASQMAKQIIDAGRKARGEIGAPPVTGMAKQIIDAGRKARGEIADELPPLSGMAKQIVNAGRKARGEPEI